MSQDASTLVKSTPVSQRRLYQSYPLEEESRRIAYHYNVPPEFFTTITGGKWHCYSSPIFAEGDSLTQAQERKFDTYAEQMRLKPDMRILDIGSGWGGPLVYLASTYGVTGIGITVTEPQVKFSRSRAEENHVDVSFELSHWADFEDDEGFDAIYTDELLGHVRDLQAFYKKCRALLKPGGRLVNKELYLNARKNQDWSDRLSTHVNQVFGFTGNYRLMDEDVFHAEKSGFCVEHILDIPIAGYAKLVKEYWIPNLSRNREYLIGLTSKEHVDDIYKYLRGTPISFRKGCFNQKLITFLKNR